MKPVLVFKTSVATAAAAARVKPLLDRLFPAGDRWNFDLDDRENILRVESAVTPAAIVIETLSSAGFYCEELTD